MVIAAVHRDTVRESARFETCLKAVSDERRERVLSLVHEDDRCLSLCAGLALDACLRTVGLRESKEPIIRDAGGKPRFLRHPMWHFSLSHSGEWAVCALGESPLGIDIERRREVRAAALAARYFTPWEAALVKRLSGVERQAAFFRLWTAKESVLKAEGTGLSGGLAVPVGYGETLRAPKPWKLREYPLAGHFLTVCGTETFPEKLLVISSFDSVPLH